MNRKPISLAIFLLLSCFAFAQQKVTRPEIVGFSSERLARITQYFQSEVDKGSIPGVVLVVGRKAASPIARPSAFRIAKRKRP